MQQLGLIPDNGGEQSVASKHCEQYSWDLCDTDCSLNTPEPTSTNTPKPSTTQVPINVRPPQSSSSQVVVRPSTHAPEPTGVPDVSDGNQGDNQNGGDTNNGDRFSQNLNTQGNSNISTEFGSGAVSRVL